MDYFAGIEFFRFNHLLDHREVVDRTFHTHGLNYLPAGRIRFKLEGHAERELSGPCAYWTWPGPRWRYHHIDGIPWEHYFVSWTGKRSHRWRRAGLFVAETSPLPMVAITNPTRFRDAFEQLHASLAQRLNPNPEAVHQLEGLLLQLQGQPAMETAMHPRRKEMMALVQKIEQAPGREVDFAAAAADLGMTLTHLRRLFRLFTGDSPIAFVNRTRLKQAARLLRTTDQPIKKIANDMGLSDVYYFTKLFRREHQVPPGQYRKAYQTIG